MRLRKDGGFTLVELLVALFVFSLLSSFSYRTVNQLLNSRAVLSSELTVFSAIQKTLLFWERDVQRSLKNSADMNVSDSGSLQVQRVSASFSLQTAVERIDYVLKGDILYRERHVLPASEDIGQQADSLALLSGVQSFSVNPLFENVGNGSPDSIDLVIQHSTLKEIRRTIFTGRGESFGMDFSTLLPPDDSDSSNLTGADGSNSTEKGDSDLSNTNTEIPTNY